MMMMLMMMMMMMMMTTTMRTLLTADVRDLQYNLLNKAA
jgi:hypothetical protein